MVHRRAGNGQARIVRLDVEMRSPASAAPFSQAGERAVRPDRPAALSSKDRSDYERDLLFLLWLPSRGGLVIFKTRRAFQTVLALVQREIPLVVFLFILDGCERHDHVLFAGA